MCTSGGRTRTADLGIMKPTLGQSADSRNQHSDKDLRDSGEISPDRSARESAAFSEIKAWIVACPATLSPELQDLILGMLVPGGPRLTGKVVLGQGDIEGDTQ